jgi:cytochrome c oxidase cbb3-type subunit 3
MCSRFPTSWALGIVVLGSMAGCARSSHTGEAVAAPSPPGTVEGVIDSALEPGVGHTLVTTDPRAATYYDNADAVNTGKRLFQQYNCSGCHSNGGGGMGPPLMDGKWIYGGRLEQIHQTLVEGRPNGMPAWGGKVPDKQLWQISAYVRSLSLPQTLEANTGTTPSQNPAPVPRSAQQDTGWTPPPNTTNDYGTTLAGPNQ